MWTSFKGIILDNICKMNEQHVYEKLYIKIFQNSIIRISNINQLSFVLPGMNEARDFFPLIDGRIIHLDRFVPVDAVMSANSIDIPIQLLS